MPYKYALKRAIPETIRQNRLRAEHATGDAPLTTLQGNALDLRGETITGCGHFITEESHEAFTALITPFLSGGDARYAA
ncbi:hypothetical protein Xmau_00996 [Xenorhabdus mauleonii]|uniref:Haloalkane dehalogenase n=1 Tax=Xenorhabdus mauleonii TaxID=351675 RepID=A0A1I3LYW9_9GAMM|nr:hypothetical protein Xmau_00996 [Xenorhabdus mauleonii]SFI89912.1 hypothetical protein SAMN05421680_104113 [Xenorhabdus mauleonii]